MEHILEEDVPHLILHMSSPCASHIFADKSRILVFRSYRIRPLVRELAGPWFTAEHRCRSQKISRTLHGDDLKPSRWSRA